MKRTQDIITHRFVMIPLQWIKIRMIHEMLQSINNYFITDKFIFERLDQRFCEQFELNSILHYSLFLNNEYEENEFMICSIDFFNDDQWFAIFRTDWIKIADILRHQNVLFLHTIHAKIIFIKISYILKTNEVQFLKNVSIMNESLFDIWFLSCEISYDC